MADEAAEVINDEGTMIDGEAETAALENADDLGTAAGDAADGTGSEDTGSETGDTAVEADDDEVVVTIGDTEPPEDETKAAPQWVKDLRKTTRKVQQENKELRERLKAIETPASQPVALGKEPDMSDDDIDFDPDLFKQKLAEWHERKRQIEDAEAQRKAEEKAQAEAWQEKLNSYGTAKETLRAKVKDFDDAEALAMELLSETQQGIIVQGADDSSLVVYALGKNPERLKELSAIEDPIKFTFAVAKLEKDLKVKNRKVAPPPEKTVTGTAPKSGSVDSTLERLRAEAERTGDYTQVHAYRSKLRAAQT